MKKTLVSSICALLFTFSGLHAQQTNTDNPNAPVFAFEEETHDFGTIKQGANGTVEFKFKNTGKEPLVISSARGSCGCTVPNWPKEPIMPNASSVIKVTYDTQRVGSFTKSVTIVSNAKGGDKMIHIKGKVEATPPEEAFPGNGTQNNAIPRAGN